jgi:hypothetical protein
LLYEEVKLTELPEHKEVDPLAVITGVAGLALIVTVIITRGLSSPAAFF